MADFNLPFVGKVGVDLPSLNDLNPLNWTNPKMNKVGKPRVLASHAKIVFKSESEPIDLGECSSFTYKTAIEIIKQWKPYGHKTTKTISEFKGYEISFACEKVDWNLAYIIYAQEKLQNGMSISNYPDGDHATFEDLEVLCHKPLFDIEYAVEHYNGVIESYIFRDFCINDFDHSNPGDNGIIIETVAGFSPKRDIGQVFAGNSELDNIKDTVTDIIAMMSEINKT